MWKILQLPSKSKKKQKVIKYERIKMVTIDNLTEHQNEALLKLNKWYYDKDSKDSKYQICLAGSAGTGKTTLCKEFIRQNEIYLRSCCVAAPTHQAKEVISQMTGIKEAKTVQELVGLKPDLQIEDFDPNNPVFKPTGTIKLTAYSIILIDEASMVNSKLAKFIKQYSDNYGIKILYIGDPYQLAPIGEKLSTVFTDIEKVELTEIIRQKEGNPLVELIAIARQDVISRTNKFTSHVKNLTEKVHYNHEEGYEIINDPKIGFDMLVNELKKDKYLTKHIAYTNQCVDVWNNAARKALIDDVETISEKDYLLGYNTVAIGTTLVIQNSASYKVLNVSIVTIVQDEIEIKFYNTEIQAENSNSSSFVRIVHKDSYNNFLLLDEMYRSFAIRNRKWDLYYKFKNNYLLLHSLGGKDNFIKKDLNYIYSITTHKSQGSTYNTVVLNLRNINTCHEASMKARLIYVALSRAKYKVIILI